MFLVTTYSIIACRLCLIIHTFVSLSPCQFMETVACLNICDIQALPPVDRPDPDCKVHISLLCVSLCHNGNHRILIRQKHPTESTHKGDHVLSFEPLLDNRGWKQLAFSKLVHIRPCNPVSCSWKRPKWLIFHVIDPNFASVKFRQCM